MQISLEAGDQVQVALDLNKLARLGLGIGRGPAVQELEKALAEFIAEIGL
ncbi:MAG: hypothetical protein JNK87_20740 [Bryobacterales bacterium]|nr:hypothetical protein [Bryobacterales bacterium]